MTDDFSFFYIWLASVEFRREKSSTWHVASNFLKTMKYSVKSKFEIAVPSGIKIDCPKRHEQTPKIRRIIMRVKAGHYLANMQDSAVSMHTLSVIA